MSVHLKGAVLGFLFGVAFGPAVIPVSAQISTDIIEKYRAALKNQATDEDMKREGGTQPRDWNYQLPEGVTTRQVTFYVDGGTPLYGKVFFPKGFSTRGRWPAVVAGHGVNALAIGIEKYAARFAERGLVAMAIDYRTYGFSSSDLMLREPDTTTDEKAVWEKVARVQLKRTNLNNFKEVEDFRAAISFLQGEPGIDPERIGIWGSSNGGAVVLATAASRSGAKSTPGATTSIASSGHHPFWYVDQIPDTFPVLFVIAEKDTKASNETHAVAVSKLLKGPTSVVTVPGATHESISTGSAFEQSATAAADWFLKHL